MSEQSDPLVAELIGMLEMARPMMEDKCCHFDWCIQRGGIVTDNQSEGFHTIVDGMHPGCAPYRGWLDSLDALMRLPG